jgi:hypothetical protein
LDAGGDVVSVLRVTGIVPERWRADEGEEHKGIEEGGDPENPDESGFGDFVSEGSLSKESARPAAQEVEEMQPGFGDAEAVLESQAFVPSVVEEGEEAEAEENKGERPGVLTLQREQRESSDVTDENKRGEGFAGCAFLELNPHNLKGFGTAVGLCA